MVDFEEVNAGWEIITFEITRMMKTRIIKILKMQGRV